MARNRGRFRAYDTQSVYAAVTQRGAFLQQRMLDYAKAMFLRIATRLSRLQTSRPKDMERVKWLPSAQSRGDQDELHQRRDWVIFRRRPWHSRD